MDYLSTIRKPIDGDMNNFVELFKQSLTHGEGMLEQILKHIRERGGKRMRPMLVFLTARNLGEILEFYSKLRLLKADRDAQNSHPPHRREPNWLYAATPIQEQHSV